MNKSLLPLTEDNSNFTDAPHTLFGLEFAQKSKELVDRMKALWSSSGFKNKQLFRNGPPTTGGTAMPNWEGAEPQTSEATDIQHRTRSPSGTNEHDTHNLLIIDFKSMLLNPFSCQGIHPPCMATHVPAGRLFHFQSNWLKITQDRWVLSTIQGYMIDFVSQPHQPSVPQPPQFSVEHTQLISMEITELLQKNAIEEVTPHLQPGFYSNFFLVPKKDGGQRPVINLKALNRFVQKEHFKMEGIHTVKDLLRQGDWLAKVDVKNAFFLY